MGISTRAALEAGPLDLIAEARTLETGVGRTLARVNWIGVVIV